MDNLFQYNIKFIGLCNILWAIFRGGSQEGLQNKDKMINGDIQINKESEHLEGWKRFEFLHQGG